MTAAVDRAPRRGGGRKRLSRRLDVNLSSTALDAIRRREHRERNASTGCVVNSMIARYADVMSELHTRMETKFDPEELDALRAVVREGRFLSVETLWRKDRAIDKSAFVAAVRLAAKESAWSLGPSRTAKLVRILERVTDTPEFFGLCDYLALDPVLRDPGTLDRRVD